MARRRAAGIARLVARHQWAGPCGRDVRLAIAQDLGDDTDGHIDDTVRFFNEDSALVVVEEKKSDENYSILQQNLTDLKKMRLLNGKQLNLVELPMPDKVIYEDQRLPASYANFYIANQLVLVPTFNDPHDAATLTKLASLFPDRKVVGIACLDLVLGLGTIHCMTQQEPA